MADSTTPTTAWPRLAAQDRHPLKGPVAPPLCPLARAPPCIHDPRPCGRTGRGINHLMGEPGTKEPLTLEELEATTAVRTGRKHILSILVENKPGVLTRIAGLFARRGFNIDTLAVGPTDEVTAGEMDVLRPVLTEAWEQVQARG